MRDQQRQQHLTAGASNLDLERYIIKGRLLRAEAVAALLTAGARGIARLVLSGISATIELGRRAIGWLAREQQRRASLRALMALDDHMLKDIGLSRSQIHAMVDGVFRTPEVGRSPQRPKALALVVNKKAAGDDTVRRAA